MKPIDDLLHDGNMTDLRRLFSLEDVAGIAMPQHAMCLSMTLPHPNTITEPCTELSSFSSPADPRLTWTPVEAGNAIWAQPVRSFW